MTQKLHKSVQLAIKTVYDKGKDDRMEQIMKILVSRKADKLSEEHPGMNGEAWFYFICEELDRKGQT